MILERSSRHKHLESRYHWLKSSSWPGFTRQRSLTLLNSFPLVINVSFCSSVGRIGFPVNFYADAV